MSEHWEHIITVALTTLGIIVSAYFSNRAKEHAIASKEGAIVAKEGADFVKRSIRPPSSPNFKDFSDHD